MDSRGPLTIGDLLQLPALEMRLLAGAAGVVRRVSWAHVSELEDPTPWLLGSELIMTTGMAIPREAGRQRAYLERLDAAGVAGLAVSAKLYVPPLHPVFHETAERLGLPVLEIPLPVPFIAIAQSVAAAVGTDLHEGLSAQLQVFGTLRWLASDGLSVTEVFARLEALSGFTLYLCTADGHPLLPGIPAPPESLASLIPNTPDGPPTIAGGYALPIPAPSGPAGFLLALRGEATASAGLAVVQHIATVAALQLTIVRHDREAARREGAETLAELLGGALAGTPARRRLARLGFDIASPVRLVIARGEVATSEETGLVARLLRAGRPHLVLRQEQQVLALVGDDEATLNALLQMAGADVGLSSPFEAGAALDLPRREAMWAVARAAEAGGGLVRYGSDPAGRWLTDDPAALRALAAGVLGGAMTWDQTHRSSIVATVRTWLERDRHNESAAFALGIHPNTLAYRLERFEHLSGRDLTATADLAEVWLALRASEHV